VQAFTGGIGGAELELAQQCAKRDGHFHVGEGRTDTATDTAAVWNPRVVVRRVADESVGFERLGVGEAVLGGVRERDAGENGVALRNDPLPQLDPGLRHPNGAVDHRAGALHLPDRGLHQLGTSRVDLGGQPREQPWVAAQPLDGPRQRRRGRFVAGSEQGQQLVGDMVIGDR
jgi:hypothetical protein